MIDTRRIEELLDAGEYDIFISLYNNLDGIQHDVNFHLVCEQEKFTLVMWNNDEEFERTLCTKVSREIALEEIRQKTPDDNLGYIVDVVE